MTVFGAFLLIAFAGLVLSEEGNFFDPCNKNDTTCLSMATQNFLEKSYLGLPKYDIKPIDPLIIPTLVVNVDQNIGLRFHFKNLTVTGLRHQKFYDYNMDTTNKSVVLKMKVDLNIVGSVTMELENKSKSFSGVYSATTTALGTSQYNYSLKTNSKDGLEYFDVGIETNTCEIIGEPNVTINEELQNALENDLDAKYAKLDYEEHKVALRKKTLCNIVEHAYVTVIHNLRASAKILPKSAFFKDI